ncbi:MAG: TetR/AcrR family transcriptional regulator [Fimbriimonas sp.]
MARQRILDAAASMAEEDGAHSLSLERVADRAGVSKGGLLYHFRTKEELMAAMLQSVIDAHDTDMDRRVAAGERYVDAVIDHCLDDHDRPGSLMSAFIAAVAVDKGAQDLVRDRKEKWRNRLEENGLSRSQSLVMSLALDGLFVGTSLGVTKLTAEDQAALREGLQQLIAPTEEERLAQWFEEALRCVEA